MSTGESFQTLLEQHRRLLYKISRLYARTDADREDLAQEITTQLWRAFPTFDGRVQFSTWMYRVALNVAISFARREHTRARFTIADDEQMLEVAGAAGEPLEVAELYARIARLDPLDRALVMLYLDGCSHRDGKFAQVYWVVAKETIEARVAEVLLRKLESMGNLQGDSTKDFEEIFKSIME